MIADRRHVRTRGALSRWPLLALASSAPALAQTQLYLLTSGTTRGPEPAVWLLGLWVRVLPDHEPGPCHPA